MNYFLLKYMLNVILLKQTWAKPAHLTHETQRTDPQTVAKPG